MSEHQLELKFKKTSRIKVLILTQVCLGKLGPCTNYSKQSHITLESKFFCVKLQTLVTILTNSKQDHYCKISFSLHLSTGPIVPGQ